MIVIDRLWPNYVKVQDFIKLCEHGIGVGIEAQHKNKGDVFTVSWGEPCYQTRGLTIESGFFNHGLHLDRVGLYERASFNFLHGKHEIARMTFPVPWGDLADKIKSKFGQPTEDVSWDGVVVIAQHPTDRSILKAGSTMSYHEFLDKVCRHYGSKAFIKLHPVTLGNAGELDAVRLIAAKHGSEVGHVGASILNSAEAVWLYNSTYAVDAMMQHKQIYQYAPGYFWQSGMVQFTNGTIPKRIVHTDRMTTEHFLSFLAWRYCFHAKMNMQRIAEMLNHAESSNEYYPVAEQYSYAHHLLYGNA